MAHTDTLHVRDENGTCWLINVELSLVLPPAGSPDEALPGIGGVWHEPEPCTEHQGAQS